MRHNSTYTCSIGRSDGKTETARSKNTGIETDWYAQPSPQLCFRCFVQREPLLRSHRFSSGPLRDASVEGASIVDVAASFGVSRPTVYQAQAAFQQAGLSGLLPKHRGPKERHKLSAEVLDYVRALRAAEPGWTTGACVQAVQEKFGVTIHRRSLERAIASKKKARNPA
jgi:transposase